MVNAEELHMNLSPVQEQFWLQYQSDPQGIAYNVSSLFEICGSFNIEKATEALRIIVNRHDSLRSRFCVGNKGPEVIISSQISVMLEEKEFSQEALEKDINTPFNIETGPLFRFIVYEKRKSCILLFLFHHIIIDLRSKEIFGEEFSQLYNCLPVLENDKLSVPIPYQYYTEQFSFFSEGEKYKNMLQFWERENLQAFPLNLTSDFERSPIKNTQGTRITGDLSSSLYMDLYRLCKKEKTYPFLILISAYYLLLYKYSGQKKISIGVPRTNRITEEYHNIFGCFVNILPMVIEFEENMSFFELLSHIRKKMLMVHRNQFVPYMHIISNTREENDRKYNPLFQVGFTNEYPMELYLDGLTAEPLPPPRHGSQLDLFLYFWERNGIFHWELEYNTSLFSKNRVELFISSYHEILKQIVKGKDFDISSMNILSKEWRRKVCFDWNPFDVNQHKFKSIHSLFEDQVLNNPEHIALIFRDNSLSYHELNRQSNIIAHILLERGAGPDSIIGISVERSFEMIIGLLGILKAGASYLPIEPSHPDEYKKYLISDTNLSILLTKTVYQLAISSSFPNLDIICLDNEITNRIDDDYSNPNITINENHRAYIFYTSGSTGKPKGVEIEHGGLSDRILWMDGTFHFGNDKKTLLKTPYNFDVSGMEIWLPLITGAPIVISEPEGHLDNTYLVDVIEKDNIAILHFVPSLLNIFLDAVDPEVCNMIEDVICCGEALPVQVVNKFYEKFPAARLHNLYGPTEATIFITYWACQKECSIVPIGKPVTNTQVYVLDKNCNPLPPGILGDLYLAGSGLARGYYRRPDLTKNAFIDHFLDSHRRMYKSGDLAMWSLEGEILFFGRIDSQIQLHGQRIELGEIESSLNRHPSVISSAVIVEGVFGADQRLIAYIVSKDEKLSIDELKNQILLTCPKYMVPSVFVFLDKIPLSANGKLDRKSLPKENRIEKTIDKPKPLEGDLEKAIAEIWMDILHISSIGSDNNFFDLGGTSLQIMELQRAIVERIGQNIPTAQLFQHTTVRTQAYALCGSNGDDKVRIQKRADKQRLSLKKNVRIHFEK